MEKAYKRLPGIAVSVDPDLCDGCGQCVQRCFVGAMEQQDSVAVPGASCKGCGRCVEICPRQVVSLSLQDEDILIHRLVERIRAVADIQMDQPP